jgi:hypothetical protein
MVQVGDGFDSMDSARSAIRSYILDQGGSFKIFKSEKELYILVCKDPDCNFRIPDIEKEFKGCLLREILASDEDVRRYLDGHMSKLPIFVLSRLKLQEEIKAEIVRAVEGM